MKITFAPQQEPCTACKFIRKKCIRPNDDANGCKRCVRKGIECVSGRKDMDLHITEDGDKDVQRWQAVTDHLDSEIDAVRKDLEQSLIRMKQQPSLEWSLRLVNGVLRLETPIQTMEELSLFTQASIRYLSPFSGLFVHQPVRFQSTSISISLGVASDIQRKELINPRRRRFSTLDRSSDSPSLPALFDCRTVIDGLVMLYLEHYNPFVGLIHRPTFLKHYNALDDPMESALALAVCIDALITLIHRTNYTPNETRMLADMFYIRCRSLLFDMYDDPAQKLTVVLVTSLIQKYVADVRLNDLEANRLVTVALLVCADVAHCRDTMTPVQWALFQRSHFRLQISSLSYSMIHDDKVEVAFPETIKHMHVLEDEPEVTKRSIRMTNEVVQFVGSPYVSFLLGKVKNTFNGEPCDILLEDIVRFEPSVKACWGNLSPLYRICDDPFDPEGYKLVQGKVPPNHLVPFATLHLVTGVITSSILQPHVMPASENSAITETIQMVRRRLISLALNSCKVVVHALDENWVPSASHLPFFGITATRYCIYCMEKLASCEDVEFPFELLYMLKKRLETRSKSLFPPNHEVNPNCSLFNIFRNHCPQSPFEAYDAQYPLPGYALLSDIFASSLSSISDQHLKLSQSS